MHCNVAASGYVEGADTYIRAEERLVEFRSLGFGYKEDHKEKKENGERRRHHGVGESLKTWPWRSTSWSKGWPDETYQVITQDY